MSALTRFNFSYLCLNGTNSTKSTSEQVSTLGVNPTTAAEVEQSALAREHAVFRAPGPGPLTAFSGRTIRNTHWRWLLVSVSMARSNSRDQSGTSLWHLVRKQWGKGLRDGADSLDEPEKQHFRSLVGIALYVGQDRPETQYAAGATLDCEGRTHGVHQGPQETETRALSKLVSMVHCDVSGGQAEFEGGSNQKQMKPCQELSLNLRISGREEDQAVAVDVGSESLSVKLCPMKSFQ